MPHPLRPNLVAASVMLLLISLAGPSLCPAQQAADNGEGLVKSRHEVFSFTIPEGWSSSQRDSVSACLDSKVLSLEAVLSLYKRGTDNVELWWYSGDAAAKSGVVTIHAFEGGEPLDAKSVMAQLEASGKWPAPMPMTQSRIGTRDGIMAGGNLSEALYAAVALIPTGTGCLVSTIVGPQAVVSKQWPEFLRVVGALRTAGSNPPELAATATGATPPLSYTYGWDKRVVMVDAQTAACVVGADGNLYVPDYLRCQVLTYGPDGTPLKALGRTGQSFNDRGLGIINSQFFEYGSLVSNRGSTTVAPNLQTTFRGFGQGQFNSPMGIALEPKPDGNIYIADTSSNRVQLLDHAGEFREWWGSGLSVEIQEQFGTANVLPEDGSHIGVHSAGSGLIPWVSKDDGGFSCPSALVVASDGSVFIVDTGNRRIQHFDREGSFLGAFSSFGGKIAIDRNNRIYECVQHPEAGGPCVFIYSPNGERSGYFPCFPILKPLRGRQLTGDDFPRFEGGDPRGVSWSHSSSFVLGSQPLAIAVGPDDGIWVSFLNGVYKFSPQGRLLGWLGLHQIDKRVGQQLNPHPWHDSSQLYVVPQAADDLQMAKRLSTNTLSGLFACTNSVQADIRNGLGWFDDIVALAVGPSGEVYVVDARVTHRMWRIQKFVPTA